jgi:hypothetical protein
MEFRLGKKSFKNLIKNNLIHFLGCLFCLLIVNISCFGQEPFWFKKVKEIKPGVSTKKDVEKLFNVKKVLKTEDLSKLEKEGWTKIITYRTLEGFLEVRYSTGNCAERKKSFGYDINKDVLVNLDFHPFKRVPIKYFILTDYAYYQVPDIVSAFIYGDSSKSIELFGSYDKVGQVSRTITSEQVKNLECK